MNTYDFQTKEIGPHDRAISGKFFGAKMLDEVNGRVMHRPLAPEIGYRQGGPGAMGYRRRLTPPRRYERLQFNPHHSSPFVRGFRGPFDAVAEELAAIFELPSAFRNLFFFAEFLFVCSDLSSDELS